MTKKDWFEELHVHHTGHLEPTARWMVGRDAMGRRAYLMHTVAPVFVAKIGEDEDDGVLSPFAFALDDGCCLFDFVWYDEPPTGKALLDLMRAAQDALDGVKTVN